MKKKNEKKQDKTKLKGFAVRRSPGSKNQSLNKNRLSNGASLLDIFFSPFQFWYYTLRKQADTSVVSHNKNHLIITMFGRKGKEKGQDEGESKSKQAKKQSMVEKTRKDQAADLPPSTSVLTVWLVRPRVFPLRDAFSLFSTATSITMHKQRMGGPSLYG